ncbi:Cyanovirin-N [Mycena albidolilacea]|uniref:Cyanovirin-N n=1 Tax=Mycena albidolilacea TaxID=1033008 RepID=A0AAD7F0B5_9AGAR|nr:Cyanovirin-N [Mycena albidolilacea]
MKTLFTAVVVALVAAFVPSEVQAANGFTSSCATWSGSGTILQATCSTISGSTITSTIDLNTCFTNTQGILAYQLNGNFAASCSNISHNAGNDRHGDTAYLSALCSAANGKKFDTAIATSTYIGNSNGVLVC